jgi:hypothetical protein
MAAMQRYTEEQRREVVRDFEASGLGTMAFCRQRGICPGSLAAWRKRYGSGLAASAPGAWLSVQLGDPPPRRFSSPAGYTIRMGDACLDVPTGFVSAEVAVLLGMLRQPRMERNRQAC